MELISKAATLKPGIRLAQALSEYEAILVDDQKAKLRISRGQSPPEATDVMRLTAEIDRNASQSRNSRCVGPRLMNLLQSVQQFSTVVDVVVGGSQSQIACAIWGVLKMSLLVISDSALLKLLSLTFNLAGCICLLVLLRSAIEALHGDRTFLPSIPGFRRLVLRNRRDYRMLFVNTLL